MASTTIQNRFVGGKDYAPLTETSCIGFAAAHPAVAAILGGAPAGWSVREVGDGNLNMVFIVKGPGGGVCIKQALPYVRVVGDGWPLPLDRAYFEYEALTAEAGIVPDLVPRIHAFDRSQAAIAMELLEPHIILRKGMIRGQRYPRLATDIARFAAETLLATSDLATPAGPKRERQSIFSLNTQLCKITEDLVFTDPYRIAKLNRWTSPHLDAMAAEFRADGPLKVAVQELKWMFLTRGEALLHGDLHTGSIMVTPEQTRVIDPEFAVYGPMGFDLGAFMANLLLAYFSQRGHAGPADDRSAYQAWILDTLEAFWMEFEQRFLALWCGPAGGDVFAQGLFEDATGAAALDRFRAATMTRLLQDAIGFAGAKMARRILGLAHVEDLESIADPDRRAACEKPALRLARQLMLTRGSYTAIAQLRSDAEAAGAA